MNKRPLAVIAVFFILGIILARFVFDGISLFTVLIFTLISILLAFIFSRHERVSDIFLFLSISLFASLLYINSNIFPKAHVGYFIKEDALRVDMVGAIKSPALTRKPHYGKINSAYLFDLEAIKGQEIKDKG